MTDQDAKNQAEVKLNELIAMDLTHCSVTLSMMARTSYKNITIKRASLGKQAVESFRTDGSILLGILKAKREGQTVHPYSYSHDIQKPDIFFEKLINNSILKAWSKRLEQAIGDASPPDFDPWDEEFKPIAMSLSFQSQDGKKTAHFVQVKYPNQIRMFRGKTTAYVFKQQQIETPEDDGVFFYTPSVYLVMYDEFCFIYDKKSFEKLFLPPGFLKDELDSFHEKISEHVPFANEALFKTFVIKKPKWMREYFIISQRDDLQKFANKKKLKKANDKLSCGVRFSKDDEIVVDEKYVSNILDLLISYGGRDIVTGAFVKTRKLTGRTTK